MTKPTQETLREAVAVIVEQSLLRHGVQLHRQEGTLDDADAAIATMFERLRTPSEGMVAAAMKARHFDWHLFRSGAAPQTEMLLVRQALRNAFTAFQQENSDA